MKANQFNICPTCLHRATCVLTDQKELVWSCSEYNEEIPKSRLVQRPVRFQTFEPRSREATV